MARAIVFSGHMIDLPGRAAPRLPAALEAAAARAIRAGINDLMGQADASPVGLSSGARGGDILFQEACRSLGLKTVIVLPFGLADFEAASVDGIAGGAWTVRFRRLWAETSEADREIMDLPVADGSFAACNLHLIDRATSIGAFDVIVLWDGKGGDGPGGTAHMVTAARAAGGRAMVIDPARLQAD